ncbi:hypothetical protein MTO96_027182 [Rhipicephalus appendiculatus]
MGNGTKPQPHEREVAFVLSVQEASHPYSGPVPAHVLSFSFALRTRWRKRSKTRPSETPLRAPLARSLSLIIDGNRRVSVASLLRCIFFPQRRDLKGRACGERPRSDTCLGGAGTSHNAGFSKRANWTDDAAAITKA